jgi:ABC-type uncharacterized transport system permease subunit
MSAIAPAARASRRRPRYVAIAATAAQQATAYRIGTLTGVIANAFWIAILYYLWRAAFSQQPRIGTFSWDEMRTYILLAYGINALIGFPAASRMMGTIRTGEIVIDMVRPLNYRRPSRGSAAWRWWPCSASWSSASCRRRRHWRRPASSWRSRWAS